MGISPVLEGYFPEGSFVWLTFCYSVERPINNLFWLCVYVSLILLGRDGIGLFLNSCVRADMQLLLCEPREVNF